MDHFFGRREERADETRNNEASVERGRRKSVEFEEGHSAVT